MAPSTPSSGCCALQRGTGSPQVHSCWLGWLWAGPRRCCLCVVRLGEQHCSTAPGCHIIWRCKVAKARPPAPWTPSWAPAQPVLGAVFELTLLGVLCEPLLRSPGSDGPAGCCCSFCRRHRMLVRLPQAATLFVQGSRLAGGTDTAPSRRLEPPAAVAAPSRSGPRVLPVKREH